MVVGERYVYLHLPKSGGGTVTSILLGLGLGKKGDLQGISGRGVRGHGGLCQIDPDELTQRTTSRPSSVSSLRGL
jgi:hypothetical protein